MTEATVGIDIGTTSVKAIAADGDGNVLASTRVPHPLRIAAPDELEHDIDLAWRDGVTNAFTAYPLFDGAKWDDAMIGQVGVAAEQLPEIVVGTEAGGRVGGVDGPVLGGGTIDAMAEQVVAGADHDGDVLVICGTTLITWAVMKGEEWLEQPGLWTIPHTAPGKLVIGGPSNAGGLFLNWARRIAGVHDDDVVAVDDPGNVPVWLPYVRGERTPLHRHDLRASLHDLNLTHAPAHVGRASGVASSRTRIGRPQSTGATNASGS